MFHWYPAYAKPPDIRSAASGPVDITASSVEYNKAANTYTAKGMVEVKEGNRILTADYVFYDDNTKDVLAEGNVVFREEEDTVECQKLSLNLVTKRGTIEKGKILISKGNFHITGHEMEKVGENRYKIKDGGITTCEGDRPDWRFTARDVDITTEGYAKAKSTRFQILNQTVFYFPYGIFPVKTERQSGLLLPQIAASSRDGPIIQESYFWVISKDKDATFYLDYIGNRGIKPGMEFRYAFSENTKGTWYGSIIDDNDYGHTRYQIKGKHEQTFFNDMNFKVNANYVSDIDYLQDFSGNVQDLPTTYQERSENLLKSTAFVEKPFKKSLFTAEASYFKNMLNRDNDTIFQSYPIMSFFTEYIPLFKGRLFTDMVIDLGNFYREKGDKVSRFDFQPALRLPYSVRGVNMLFSGALIESAYLVNGSDTQGSDNETRQTFKIEGEANMQFVRNYDTTLFDIGEMQSLMKPRIRYSFMPNSSFRDLPFVDPSDRLYHGNTVTYALNHYLNALSGGDGTRELSLLEVEQTYSLSGDLNPSYEYPYSLPGDLNPAYNYRGPGGKFSDIYARLTLYPKKDVIYKNETIINTHGNGLTGMKNELRYIRPNYYHANVTHSYTQDLNHETYLDIGGQYWYLEGKYQIRYSFRDSDWVDVLYQLTYRPACWGVSLSMGQSKRPRDTRLHLAFELAGISGK